MNLSTLPVPVPTLTEFKYTVSTLFRHRILVPVPTLPVPVPTLTDFKYTSITLFRHRVLVHFQYTEFQCTSIVPCSTLRFSTRFGLQCQGTKHGIDCGGSVTGSLDSGPSSDSVTTRADRKCPDWNCRQLNPSGQAIFQTGILV